MSASYASVSDVTTLAPELASVNPAQLALIVDVLTQAMISVDDWGTRLSEGHTLLAAHWATIELNPAGAGGVVTSRRLDKISETYQVAAMSDSELSTTKYGRMFLALRAQIGSSVAFTSSASAWDLPDGRVL